MMSIWDTILSTSNDWTLPSECVWTCRTIASCFQVTDITSKSRTRTSLGRRNEVGATIKMCTDDISIGCLNSGLEQQIPAALFIELLITIQPSVVCITVWKTVNLRKDVTLDSNLSASFSWRRNNPWVSELHVAMANSNLLRCTELVERWVHATGGAAAELCSAVLFFSLLSLLWRS